MTEQTTKKEKRTIAIDFDGVIHKYSHGWTDGSIYDNPDLEVIDAMERWLKEGHYVFIFSTRSPFQIKRWFDNLYYDDVIPVVPFRVKVIMPWHGKFWNKKGVVGITQKKLVASVYIDDRAFRFNGKNISHALKGAKLD